MLVCGTLTLLGCGLLLFAGMVHAQTLHDDHVCSSSPVDFLSLPEEDTDIFLYYKRKRDKSDSLIHFQKAENADSQAPVAQEERDYTINSQRLSLSSSSEACIKVKLGTIIEDQVPESREVFTLGLFIDDAQDPSFEIEITLVDDDPVTWSILANNVTIASIQEGARLSITIFYQGTLPQNTTQVSFVVRHRFAVLGYAPSQPEDFVQSLSEALKNVSGITTVVISKDEVQVTFPISREERTFQGISFSFIAAEDERTENIEAFTLEIDDVSIGEIGFQRIIGLIILGDTSVLDDVATLTTPLTLYASAQSLSSAVHTQITQVLRNKVPHSPMVTENTFRAHLFGLSEAQAPLKPHWDLWSSGSFTAVKGGFPRKHFVKSEIVNLWLGLDYRVTDSFMAGTLFGYESSHATVDSFNARLEGRGTAFGVYMGGKLREVIGDLSFVWMGLGYESRGYNGAVNTTAEFSGRRFLVTGNLRGHWQEGQFWLDPMLGFMWGHEWQEHYRDSLNFEVEERTTLLGQLFFGPEVGYRLVLGEGEVLEPFLGIRGVYTFENESHAATAPVHPTEEVFAFDSSESQSVDIHFGVTRKWGKQLLLQLKGNYRGIGTSAEALSGSLTLSYSWNETLRLLWSHAYEEDGLRLRTMLMWSF